MGRSSVDSESLVGPGAGLMQLMGIWQPQEATSRFLSTLSGFVTLVFIAFVAISAALKLCVDTPEELEDVAHCSFVALICSVMWIKAVLFIVHGATLRQLVQMLADTRVQHNQGEGNECTRRRYQRNVQRVYSILQVVVVAALIEWLSSPLVSRVVLGNDESSRQLPLPIWLPFDAYVSPAYEILYAAQSVGLTIAAECAACIDIFFVHTMQVTGAEFEVLSDNFSALQKNHEQVTSAKNAGGICECQAATETLALSCADICTEYDLDEQMHRQLTRNIRHHQILLRSISLLQSTMSVPIFILLFVNMANLCANLFIAAVLLQRDGNVSKALKALMTIPPVLYETGMYCIFGQVLTDKSEKLMQSAFSCGWTECDIRFRRSLQICMTSSVRPVEITVGKTTKLSKQTLLQVLNGTYGLLNMLYHFHSSL